MTSLGWTLIQEGKKWCLYKAGKKNEQINGKYTHQMMHLQLYNDWGRISLYREQFG